MLKYILVTLLFSGCSFSSTTGIVVGDLVEIYKSNSSCEMITLVIKNNNTVTKIDGYNQNITDYTAYLKKSIEVVYSYPSGGLINRCSEYKIYSVRGL